MKMNAIIMLMLSVGSVVNCVAAPPGTYFVPAAGTGNRVEQVADDATKKVHRTVAFLGGSITEMDGFRPRVMKLLRTAYPSVAFREIAAGLSSTCSDTGAFRMEEDVLSQGIPDLFIVESAVNDDQDGHFDERHCLRGVEGCVRRMRRANPACAIVVGLLVNEGQFKALSSGEVPLPYRVGARVAAHYGAALADVGSALVQASRSGGMDWATYADCHPSPAGCDFAAQVVMKAVEKVFDPESTAPSHALPDLLDAFSYAQGKTVPLESVACSGGWRVAPVDWQNVAGEKRSYFTQGKALWTEKPQSQAKIAFEGTALGALLTAGPDAGDLEVSLDGGPFKMIRLRANYGSLHYPYTLMLADDLSAGAHTVHLRSLSAQRGAQTGAVIRIHRLSTNAR